MKCWQRVAWVGGVCHAFTSHMYTHLCLSCAFVLCNCLKRLELPTFTGKPEQQWFIIEVAYGHNEWCRPGTVICPVRSLSTYMLLLYCNKILLQRNALIRLPNYWRLTLHKKQRVLVAVKILRNNVRIKFYEKDSLHVLYRNVLVDQVNSSQVAFNKNEWQSHKYYMLINGNKIAKTSNIK